ncbi:hypothetical protein DBV05_g10132 [Lasiodiplodia theobromae]|uniref:ZZ-type domain-containing protein n=1 Tax=Lasiodiplodia theobromae TaxID=45133 RepID=A0A5N5D1E4_9PEZI|nr:hypothetical protein DBV05_g10132 [Lasiodiplodia theobromae]
MSSTIRNPIVVLPGQPDDDSECNTIHYGVCCDGPGCEEIEDYIAGIRYKCSKCPNVDFCASCLADPRNTHEQEHPVLKCITQANFVYRARLPQEETDEVVEALSRNFQVVRLGDTEFNPSIATPMTLMGRVPTSLYLDRWLRVDLLWGFLNNTVNWSKTKLEPAVGTPMVAAPQDQATTAISSETGNGQQDALVVFKNILEKDVQWSQYGPQLVESTPFSSDPERSRVSGYEVRDYEKTENGIRILGPKPPESKDFVSMYTIGEDGRPTVEFPSAGSDLSEERQVGVLHDTEELLSLSNRLTEHEYTEDDEFYRLVRERKPAARIMELLPGDGEEKLQCRLISTTIDQGFQYEALSYSPDEGNFNRSGKGKDSLIGFNSRLDIRYPVYLESSFIKVTMTLRDALRRLRQKDKSRFIWVDQVSIDQRYPQEHQIQVLSTPAIFNRAQRVLVWAGEEDEHSAAAISLCEKLSTKCNRGVPRHDLVMTTNLIRNRLQTGDEMSLGLLLNSTRHFPVADPRDKIFALLGLHPTGFGIKPDYSKHVSEVFIEATKRIITLEKAIDICGKTPARLQERKNNLPSWVPDYTVVSADQVLELSTPEARYSAAAGAPSSVSWPLQRHPNILQTPTYLVETITAVSDEPLERGLDRILWWTRFAASLGPRYVTGETALEAFWRTCVVNASVMWHHQPAPNAYLVTLAGVAIFLVSQMLDSGDNQLQDLMNPLLQDLLQAFPSSDPSTRAILEDLFDEVTMHFQILTKGRRLFSTKSGYLCLAASSTRIGDGIHIIPGAKAPFVLRRIKKGPMEVDYGDLDAYIMIGETYVHGLMSGEALKRDGFEWKPVLIK